MMKKPYQCEAEEPEWDDILLFGPGAPNVLCMYPADSGDRAGIERALQELRDDPAYEICSCGLHFRVGGLR